MQKPDDINLDVANNGYLNLLLTLEEGELVEELDGEIKRLIQLVKNRGSKAKLTLRMEFSTLKNNRDVLSVSYKVDAVEPARERQDSIMFSDRYGGLVTHQPDQIDLDFTRTEEKTTGPVTPIRSQ